MTVENNVHRNDYISDGVNNVYDYTFRILTANELLVYTSDSDGQNTTQLTINADYIVQGAGEYGGGTVTLLTSVPPLGHKIALIRQVEATQLLNLKNQNAFFAEDLENSLDKLTMLVQQLKGLVGLINNNGTGGTGGTGGTITPPSNLNQVALNAADGAPGYLDDKLAGGNHIDVKDQGTKRVVSHGDIGAENQKVSILGPNGDFAGSVSRDDQGHMIDMTKSIKPLDVSVLAATSTWGGGDDILLDQGGTVKKTDINSLASTALLADTDSWLTLGSGGVQKMRPESIPVSATVSDGDGVYVQQGGRLKRVLKSAFNPPPVNVPTSFLSVGAFEMSGIPSPAGMLPSIKNIIKWLNVESITFGVSNYEVTVSVNFIHPLQAINYWILDLPAYLQVTKGLNGFTINSMGSTQDAKFVGKYKFAVVNVIS